MGLKNLIFGGQKASENTELAAFYSGRLQNWLDICNGGGDWRYTRKGGLNGGTRRVASLGAAKALCA